MKRALLALAKGLLCFGNSALADTLVKWNGISAQLPIPVPVGNYEPVNALIWTGGGSATLNLTRGTYQFQVKYLSWAMPMESQPIGATLDNTIPLRAVFVCDSLGSAFALGPVPFNLDKTGSANIKGVLMDKSQCAMPTLEYAHPPMLDLRRSGSRLLPARVLVADDQRDVLEALRLLLKGEGYQLETASSPAGGLAALDAREFDLALIDLNYARDTTSGQEGLDLSPGSRRSMPRCRWSS